MHDDLVNPASYDGWLTGLKEYLDRHPGIKADLARHLVNSNLPELGKLRYFAKVEKVELVTLVKQHGASSRKAFENAKPFADVLELLAPYELPQAVYNALTYREARELSKALEASKHNVRASAAIDKFMRVSKFHKGWVKTLCEKLKATLAPINEIDDEPEKPEAHSVQLQMTVPEFLESVADLASRLPASSSELARNNLARAVNDTAAWALFKEPNTR